MKGLSTVTLLLFLMVVMTMIEAAPYRPLSKQTAARVQQGRLAMLRQKMRAHGQAPIMKHDHDAAKVQGSLGLGQKNTRVHFNGHATMMRHNAGARVQGHLPMKLEKEEVSTGRVQSHIRQGGKRVTSIPEKVRMLAAGKQETRMGQQLAKLSTRKRSMQHK